MPRFNETSIVIHDCTIVWDGMTRPDKAQDGSPKYNLKLVFPPNSPDLAEFSQIAQEKLQSSPFNGVLPQGGRMPVGTAGPQEFGGLFPGYATISAKTQFMPEVRDDNVNLLDPMQWAALMFTGQKVNVLVDCYHYDTAGNKGIGTGLQGVQIVTSANAQRIQIGGGSLPDTAAAFGGQPGVSPQAVPPLPPAYGQPPVQAPPPVQQPAYGQPAQGLPPQQPQQPGVQGYVQPGPPTGQPVQQPGPPTSGYAQPVQPVAPVQPQQATNFLPPVQT